MLTSVLPAAVFVILFPLATYATPFPIPANTTVDVADKYIITLRPGADFDRHLNFVTTLSNTNEEGTAFGGLSRRFNISDYQAYTGHFHGSVIDQLWEHGDVEDIEPDQVWSTTSVMTQNNPPYGLNLISHRGLSQDQKGYSYDSSAGKGTFGYILDTGIDVKHPEFEGRAYHGFNVIRTSPPDDHVGHGTHVAGTIGSRTFGVAKRCELIAVKVLEGFSGSMSDIQEGYDWAVKDIIAHKRKRVAVINMSLGGPLSRSFNRAIDAALEIGVTTVVAAGNNNGDASDFSPASAAGAITVGATDKYRGRANFSNWGTNVTLFAPGVDVLSTWPGNGTRSLSGTSMASPHIAGLCLYLQSIKIFTNAKILKRSLTRLATRKVIADVKGSPNLFAYNNGV
ncbi:hypothetical protein ANO11243_002860 [Dothideomycetidae sp. 11243]|nr:hypothetical protein ANO11243_002860 [fungal sp. No.11243]